MSLKELSGDLAVGIGCFFMCLGISLIIITIGFVKWLLAP